MIKIGDELVAWVNQTRLRKYFCVVYNCAGKVDLSK